VALAAAGPEDHGSARYDRESRPPRPPRRRTRAAIVVFTGAGRLDGSTASRTSGAQAGSGRRTAMIYCSTSSSARATRAWRSWTRLFEDRGTMLKAEPNAGHRALAKLVGRGQGDRRHHAEHRRPAPASGVPASRVIEIHGNATFAKCLECGAQGHEFAGRRARVRRRASRRPAERCWRRMSNRQPYPSVRPCPRRRWRGPRRPRWAAT